MTFVNLSNHPSAGWSPEQRAAAEALGGVVVDVAFPDVPPMADTADVVALAREVCTRLPPDARLAMVQGEATLLVALVAELHARGVRCFAATTQRNSVDHGDGRRTLTFTFVRFRDYP